MKLYFLDPRLIQSSQGLELRLGRVRKSPHNPLMIEDKPWESTFDNMYPNVLRDTHDGLFKLWYTPFLDRARHNAQTLCYAESRDGIHWTKPELGLVEICGTRRNNVLLPFITGAGVAIDPATTNPEERFKMTYLVHPELAPEWATQLVAAGHPLSRRGGGVGFSRDGIHWNLRPDNPVLSGIAGDTHNYWLRDPLTGKFVWITRANVPFEIDKLPANIRPTGAERVVKRWESDDFIHWRDGRIVFRAAGDEIGRRQYYSMPSFRFGDGYLGLLSLLNNDPSDDTVDVELAWSADTIHWQRLCPGESFIPRAPAGGLDAGCIYAGWSPLDVSDDETWIYYAGSVGKHGSGLQRRSSFLLATLSRDRFAGLTARDEGELVTVAFPCQGQHLFINAAPVGAAAGELSVEVQRPDGTTIPGYELTSCLPIRDDDIRCRVVWQPGRRRAPERPGSFVRLRVRVRQAAIYSATWRDEP